MTESAPKTVTVYHPTLPDVQQEVLESSVDAWTDQGWRKSKPKSSR